MILILLKYSEQSVEKFADFYPGKVGASSRFDLAERS
jgi:hypothetical protein